jgi:hypothetical protein
MFSVSGCSTDEKGPSTDKAKRYEVIENTAVGLPGTKKRRATILSQEAKGHDELAQTVIKAALDLQRQEQADSVEVFLVPLAENLGDGRLYAKAEYNPRANKVTQKWDVKAAERVLSEDELLILSRWLQFENKRAAIDEIDVNKLSDKQLQLFNEKRKSEEEKETAKIAKEKGISVERVDEIVLSASPDLMSYELSL